MPSKNTIGLLILTFILSLILFINLGDLPIQLWDESRLAINSLEMTASKNVLITTYNGAPDMWSTKPPLAIWIQALSIDVFGYTEIALRLPSALAGLITCIFLFWFLAKKVQHVQLGYFACLVLITSYGFVRLHGARTGDYDALLTLFTTVYCVCFFLYLEKGKKRHFLYTMLFMVLAVFTKGVAGLLFTPALLVYAIFKRDVVNIFRQPTSYLGLIAFLLITVGYYFLREHFNPGYLQAVYDNELGGRYNSAIEQHNQSITYYIRVMVVNHFKYWYMFLPCGIVLGI